MKQTKLFVLMLMDIFKRDGLTQQVEIMERIQSVEYTRQEMDILDTTHLLILLIR